MTAPKKPEMKYGPKKKPIGRPRKVVLDPPVKAPKKISITAAIDDELNVRLRQAAKDRHTTMAFVVENAITYYLDRLIPIREMKWTKD